MQKRVLNVGIIGGGGGAFIVHPHTKAIFMDGTRHVACAALHQDPEQAMKFAAEWPYPITGYPGYNTMLIQESLKPVGERMDYVLIVTPNFAHHAQAMACLIKGFPVFCEKPLTTTLYEAEQLVQSVEICKLPFGVAHTYLGHWTSRFSRYIVQAGLLGEVRWVDSSYIQGWLATDLENKPNEGGNQQASWRVDPKQAGGSGCGGDIGTHALMQLRYITGLEVTSVSAHLEKFVEGRQLDDHFTAYCQLSNGGKALVRASQVCIGYKNDLGITVAGTKGTLIWRQEDPEALTIRLPGQPDRVYYRGAVTPGDGFIPMNPPEDLMAEPTIPSGHTEGFHDAFARLHRCFEADVRAFQAGQPFICDGSKYANVQDGQMGIAFIGACVQSSAHDGQTIAMPKLWAPK